MKLTDITLPCPVSMVSCFSYQVTWKQADPTGVTIKIYAVKDCLNPPIAPDKARTCVTPGTIVPTASLILLGSVPAATGTFTFQLNDGATYGYGWFTSGDYAYAVIVRATNAAGVSPWIIAGSSSKCDACAI